MGFWLTNARSRWRRLWAGRLRSRLARRPRPCRGKRRTRASSCWATARSSCFHPAISSSPGRSSSRPATRLRRPFRLPTCRRLCPTSSHLNHSSTLSITCFLSFQSPSYIAPPLLPESLPHSVPEVSCVNDILTHSPSPNQLLLLVPLYKIISIPFSQI